MGFMPKFQTIFHGSLSLVPEASPEHARITSSSAHISAELSLISSQQFIHYSKLSLESAAT